VALSAFATERRSAAPLMLSAGQQWIDIYCSLAAQQQTRSSGVRLADIQTDRQTPDHYIDPAPHTNWIVPIKSLSNTDGHLSNLNRLSINKAVTIIKRVVMSEISKIETRLLSTARP